MIRFRREISTAMKAASAPSRNAGAAACEITCDSWLTDGVSGIIGSVPRDARKIGPDRHCPEGLMVLRPSTRRTASQSSVFAFRAWYRSRLGWYFLLRHDAARRRHGADGGHWRGTARHADTSATPIPIFSLSW